MPPQPSKRKRTTDGDTVGQEPSSRSGPSSPNKAARHHGPAAQPLYTNSGEIDLSDSDSDDGFGPSAAGIVKTSLPAKSVPSVLQPSLPSMTRNNNEIDIGSDSDESTGPAPPPSTSTNAVSTQNQKLDSASDSDSDDDYGPALPGANVRRGPIGPTMPSANQDEAPTRDAWMIEPPTASGYSERDPTKLRARKFVSKTGPSDGTVSSIWTETPEEKLRRLQDSVLGRTSESTASSSTGNPNKGREEEERNQRIAANIQSQRGQSLYDQHVEQKSRENGGKIEEEDDPSKRAFDREKDMALSTKIGAGKRNEFVAKSANFGGRFQKGSYL